MVGPDYHTNSIQYSSRCENRCAGLSGITYICPILLLSSYYFADTGRRQAQGEYYDRESDVDADRHHEAEGSGGGAGAGGSNKRPRIDAADKGEEAS